MDITFDEWLEQTAELRASLMAYGQTGKPDEASLRALDSIKAIELTDKAERILAEAESFLTLAKEQAMFAVRKEHPDLNSRERELVEKSRVRKFVLLVEGCRITYNSCRSRYFVYQGK